MTTVELRQKHPTETSAWTEEQCQQYCRTLESMASSFIEYVEKKLQLSGPKPSNVGQLKLDSYGR